jgi:hypothetical protein
MNRRRSVATRLQLARADAELVHTLHTFLGSYAPTTALSALAEAAGRIIARGAPANAHQALAEAVGARARDAAAHTRALYGRPAGKA